MGLCSSCNTAYTWHEPDGSVYCYYTLCPDVVARRRKK